MVEVGTSGLHCNFCFKAITYFVRSEVKLGVNLFCWHGCSTRAEGEKQKVPESHKYCSSGSVLSLYRTFLAFWVKLMST